MQVGTATRRLPPSAVVAAVLAVMLAIASATVASGATVRLDDDARWFFWPSGRWLAPQRLSDLVVEGLSPRVTVVLLLAGAAVRAVVERVLRPVVVALAAVVVLAVALVVLGHVVGRTDLHDNPGSFPSGHEAMILLAGGSLARLYLPRRLLGAGTAVVGGMACLMALALLTTGTHWLSDVVGGALLGGLLLAAAWPWTPAATGVPAAGRRAGRRAGQDRSSKPANDSESSAR